MFRSTVLLCSLYFLALTPYLARAATEEQKAKIKEELEKLGAECMADFPITEDDINDFKSKKIPAGDGVPCFVACMMKKMGVAINNEQIAEIQAKFIEVGETCVKDHPLSEEDIQNFKQRKFPAGENAPCFTALNDLTDDEKACERAKALFSCFTDNLSKFDF
ncbi:unnamed protein product [Chilo suppressalis]|uniref:Odorant binding protein n=1 Tax=Chilo suppressalis TaxID=168631 RepID=A0ABN8AY16_CHISP|nr:unnamed protein product [Chilo suppressalis]